MFVMGAVLVVSEMEDEIKAVIVVAGTLPLERFKELEEAVAQLGAKFGISLIWPGAKPGKYAEAKLRQLSHMRFQASALIAEALTSLGDTAKVRMNGELDTLQISSTASEEDIREVLCLAGRENRFVAIRRQAVAQYYTPRLTSTYRDPNPEKTFERLKQIWERVHPECRRARMMKRCAEVFGGKADDG